MHCTAPSRVFLSTLADICKEMLHTRTLSEGALRLRLALLLGDTAAVGQQQPILTGTICVTRSTNPVQYIPMCEMPQQVQLLGGWLLTGQGL